MAYVGVDINYGNIAKQTATSTGSTTPTGALTYSVPSSESIMVMLDGVTQVPGTDFNVTGGTTLTFTSSVSADVVVLVYFLGRSIDIGTPGDSTITLAKMTANSVDSDQYVDGSIDNDHIADDAIDSEHYAAGSIDTAHIATNQIDETLMKDAFVGDFTDATVTASDYFIHGDATDSGNTKKDTVQGILDLAPGPEYDTGLFTHDISVTGTQAVTGVGFQPTHLIFFANVQNSSKMSVGFDDGTTDNGVGSEHAGTAGRWTADGSSIYLYHSSGNAARGTVSALGADGFTITWSKSGSPTGSAMTAYMAFK